MYTIRTISPKDYDTIADIKIRSISICSSAYSKEEIKNWLKYCLNQNNDTYFKNTDGFIIMKRTNEKEEPIGFSSFSSDNNIGKIDNLFIIPEYNQLGLGKILFDKSENALHIKNVKAIHIRATLNAQKFYERYGYIAQDYGTAKAGFKIINLSKEIIS